MSSYASKNSQELANLGFENTHITIRDGLPNNKVFSIFQDPAGFMWFGTRNGLAKFDGYDFTIFKKDPLATEKTLSYNGVTDFVSDNKGEIWTCTFGGGINRIDVKSGEITSFKIDRNKSSDRDVCYQVILGNKGLLWIASKGGLNCFNTKTGEFKLFSTPDALSPEVLSLHQDVTGALWVGTRNHLYKFNTSFNSFSEFSLSDIRSESVGVAVIYPGKYGHLWMASKKGELFSVDVLHEKVRHYAVPKNLFEHWYDYPKTSLCTDNSGNLWIAPSNNTGIFVLDVKNEKWRSISVGKAPQPFLHSNTVYSLFKSKDGIIWVGTNNGVEKLIPTSSQFNTIRLVNADLAFREYENSIRVARIDKSSISWVVNDNGNLYSYDRSRNILKRYDTKLSAGEDPGDNFVISICLDFSGNLWVATKKSVFQYIRSSDSFRKYTIGYPIKIIQSDSHGNIWIFGSKIGILNIKSGSFRNYKGIESAPFDMERASLRTSVSTKYGEIWLAYFRQGLVRLNVAKGSMKFYRYNNKTNSLSDNDVHSLCEGSDGDIWIGTQQGGLNRFDVKNGKFSVTTSNDGLPSDQIESIQQDKSGLLWLGTSGGLCRYDPTTKLSKIFYETDGLQDDEFQEASAIGPQGELLFGGPDGFNIFDPKKVTSTSEDATAFITSFRVNERKIILNDTDLELNHMDNNISIEFVSPSFRISDHTRYAYKLVGLEKEWHYSGNRRFVSYSNLAPGKYNFLVKASNRHGIWSLANDKINFEIIPPFWMNWYFILLIGGGTLTGVLTLFKYRVKEIKKKESEKSSIAKQIAEMEMKALKAQMNPHFIFNSLNSINRFILENESEIASDYLIKFSKLIRLILQNSNESSIGLSKELEALKLYITLESLRFDHIFSFSILVDENVEVELIKIPPLIIQPFVENAIWHGLMHKSDSGYLEVRVFRDDQLLFCEIEDNGVGREMAAQLKTKSALRSKSLGMEITSSRLHILSSILDNKKSSFDVVDLFDGEGKASGTLVRLSIPI